MNEMHNKSRVGVAIPTYNREGYLRKLLSTIPDNIDVAISDNGNYCSPEFRQEFPNRKFIGSDTVVDVIKNWNNAVTNLDTEWVCVASDDDIFYPNAFTRFESCLKAYPDAEIIIFGHNNIDEDDLIINSWSTDSLIVSDAPGGYNVFRYGVEARVIGVFFKKELYNRIGKFDETYKVTASDSDFIQLALLKGKSVIVPEITVGYRVWRKSMTGQLIATKNWMDEVILWQDKIAIELKRLNFTSSEIKKNTSEVIARNLLSGLASLSRQKKNLKEAIQFLSQFKFPYHATLRTQTQIIKCLLRIGLKI